MKMLRLNRRVSALVLSGALTFAFSSILRAEDSVTTQTISVQGEEVPSSYGATPDFSRSRFSNLTQAYVLPPGAVFASLIYQGDSLKFNQPDHLFTQEVEIGLPNRFGIAFENSVEHHRGTTQERTFSIEGRFALANW